MYTELIGLKGVKLYNLVIMNGDVWTRAGKGKAGTGLENGAQLTDGANGWRGVHGCSK